MISYRADLQVLRGIALVLVFFYHLNFAGFENGFLGVDLFFVLSGYLMTLLTDNCSIVEFYKKRIGRLIPAYLATIFFTYIAVLLITIPSDSNQFLARQWFHLFGLSNNYFWLENSYFSEYNFRPLLNFWSLGLELQFYFIAPLLLPKLRGKKYLNLIIICISVLISFYVLTISPKTSFFIMPLRIWQFLIGSQIAWYPIKLNINSKAKRKFLGIFLLTLFFGLIFLFPIEINSKSIIFSHPGIASLLISIISALMISLGLNDLFKQNNVITKCLVKLGDYSYSIYLVHFPVIILVNYKYFNGTQLGAETFHEFILIILITFVTSYFLHNFIEKARYKDGVIYKNLSLFISIILIGFISPQLSRMRFSKQQLLIFNAFKDRSEYRCGKIKRAFLFNKKVCALNKIKNSKNVLLLGNSHADAIKKEFTKIMNFNNLSTFFYIENDPLFSKRNRAEIISNSIKRNNINIVVIHFSSDILRNISYLNEIKLFTKIMDDNQIKVYFIAPVPSYPEHIPEILYRNTINSNINLPLKNPEIYFKDNDNFFKFLKDNNFEKISFYPHLYLCNYKKCQIQELDKPYYFDKSHLTLTGSKKLKPLFKKLAIEIKK